MKICNITKCEEKQRCKGLCTNHYYKLWKYNNPLYVKICNIDGCKNRTTINILCMKHKRQTPEEKAKQHKYDNSDHRKAIRKEYNNSEFGIINNKKNSLKHNFNMTLEEYEQMVKDQDNKCASCGNNETTKVNNKVINLSVDHNHNTGKVRGLLCGKCNKSLGLLKDDPIKILSLYNYIMEFK